MKTIINIKADKDIKEKASRTARQMGLPLSTILNAFLRQFVLEKSITFSIPFKPTKWLERVLEEADKDFREDKNIKGPFYSADEMMKSLRS